MKGIKKVVSEFNSLHFGNWARIFLDEKKNEVYLFEYADQVSGPALLPKGVREIAHLARRNGCITMQFLHNRINDKP